MTNISWDFRERTAIVTGAARGIGLELSRKLTEAGAAVYMVDVDAQELEQAASAAGGIPAAADVSRTADVERLVARTGFSRFVVTDAAGEPAGYLHLKDVLYADEVERDIAVPVKRVRKLATVQAADEVEDVLATMQRTGAHLARVVDPQGKDIGVVFLEDVIEELVGEVTDASQR